jgi:hypothetical protein
VKADRLPAWKFRRLTSAQRDAFDCLRWERPGPAERARCKLVLGWKRTFEETVALAEDLLAEGLVVSAVRDSLRIGDRQLRRVLAELRQAENGSRKPSVQAGVADITCETEGDAHRDSYTVLRTPRKYRSAGQTWFECPRCDEVFADRGDYEQHACPEAM